LAVITAGASGMGKAASLLFAKEGASVAIIDINEAAAKEVAGQIQAGMVWVNTYRYIRYNIPYGGYKISGLNRENGSEGLEPYFETKSTIINLGGNYADAYAQ
jgi:aldehyde dehydrogenase (NAD+)